MIILREHAHKNFAKIPKRRKKKEQLNGETVKSRNIIIRFIIISTSAGGIHPRGVENPMAVWRTDGFETLSRFINGVRICKRFKALAVYQGEKRRGFKPD